MKPILEVLNIGKKYKIGHLSGGYLSLREKITNSWRVSKKQAEDFWALQDVSFNVGHGESVGVIGRNGAGKSTLLKVLSKITRPSTGKIISRGRIASLLEVGTGFHPELTGRENVFLNGSILGMKRDEIARQFDEIVDFAGTEKFLDTPLKHYSSGMQLRLAFAVAAFLEPEILVIDEVLAVGDSEFQKKCLGKMEAVSKSGRTILFVSHNMSAVQTLCKSALLMDKGRVINQSSSQNIINEYINLLERSTEAHLGIIQFREQYIIKKIEILCDGNISPTAYMGCSLEIKVYFESKEFLDYPVLGLIIKDYQNTPLIGINNKHYSGNVAKRPVQKGCISMVVPSLTLYEGNYVVDIHFGNAFKDLEIHRECFFLPVEAMKFSATGEMPDSRLNKFFIKDVAWTIH